MTEINDDGFSESEIETALSILETLKSRAESNDEENEYADISQTQFYLRNYKHQSEWRKERPSDRVDTSNNTTLSECVETDSDV